MIVFNLPNYANNMLHIFISVRYQSINYKMEGKRDTNNMLHIFISVGHQSINCRMEGILIIIVGQFEDDHISYLRNYMVPVSIPPPSTFQSCTLHLYTNSVLFSLFVNNNLMLYIFYMHFFL